MLVSKELRDRGFSYYDGANEYRYFDLSVRYMRGKYYLTQFLGRSVMTHCFDTDTNELMFVIDYLML